MVHALLEAYVTISVKLNEQCGSILDDKDISEFFGEKVNVFEEKFIACRILLFYYALFYEECLITNSKTLDKNRTYLKSIAKIFENIPIYYYYTYVESHVTDFLAIYGSFIRLITNQFPHVFLNDISIEQLVSSCDGIWLENFDDKSAVNILTACNNDDGNSNKSLNRILFNEKFYLNDNFNELLNIFCCKIPEIFGIDFDEGKKENLITAAQNLSLIDTYGKLFDRLEKIHPLKLYVLTIKYLLPSKNNSFYRKLTYDDLCED
uniref:Uncharacterized protein n=1 Tax=Romanomermis culicivorax TaxID=13658 RepID=A0A915K753_ROMCU